MWKICSPKIWKRKIIYRYVRELMKCFFFKVCYVFSICELFKICNLLWFLCSNKYSPFCFITIPWFGIVIPFFKSLNNFISFSAPRTWFLSCPYAYEWTVDNKGNKLDHLFYLKHVIEQLSQSNRLYYSEHWVQHNSSKRLDPWPNPSEKYSIFHVDL